MGIAQDILDDWQAAEAALLWQIDLGVEEWLLDEAVDRYALPESAKPVFASAPPVLAQKAERRGVVVPAPMPEAPKVDPVLEARNMAAKATSLEALRDQMLAFEHCDLKKGARNCLFADGKAGAKVMVVCDVPSAEEDREGRPFVARHGQLFEQMFSAIGLSRETPDLERALYVVPAVPWRTPGERAPLGEEIDRLRPFLERHIELAAPEVVVVMGHAALAMLTSQRSLLQARGQWFTAMGRPLLAMASPAHLLRQPISKREAWADLLVLKGKITP